MANTVIITGVSTVGDVSTVTGTVNGQSSSTQVWQSAITKFATALQVQIFLANALVASLGLNVTPTTTSLYNGTLSV